VNPLCTPHFLNTRFFGRLFVDLFFNLLSPPLSFRRIGGF
jgi:hypothetical protein